MIAIGIDTGIHTGIAIWDMKTKEFELLKTMKILDAMEIILQQTELIQTIIVEDARQVRFKTSPEKAKGAGSVCRDASIWEDFCRKHNFAFQMKRPNKHLTKLDEVVFAKITGYKERTSSHARDAGMLVFGMQKNNN